jgi:hypothetical protein
MGARRASLAATLAGMLMLLGACAPHPTWPPPGLGAAAPAPPTRAAAPAGPPQRLRIPAIGLDWPVVPVGLGADGAMDAPQGAPDSAVWHEGFWWRGGYRVGEAGNAVIAGHVDDDAGALTTFARIAELQPGDAVLVSLAGGGVVTFRVERVARVPVPVGGPNDPTMRAIFGPAGIPRLNLITCAGAWASGGFDERLVVYTTRVTGSV